MVARPKLAARRSLPECGILRLERTNTGLKSLDRHCNILDGDLPRDVLMAVDIPGVDLDQNHALDTRGIRWVGNAGKQRRVMVND
jgi:hypothetical protein